MKSILYLLLLILIAGSISNLRAEPENKLFGDVATDWPGIHFQIFHIERLAGNRILVGVKVLATTQAPSLTSINVRTPIPKNTDPEQVAMGAVGVAPFSLETAIMTNEATKEIYPVAKPDLAGQTYLPSQMLGNLHPNEADTMSIQFIIPPPQPDKEGNVSKLLVSLQLPKAKGLISHIEIPAPSPMPSTPAR